MRRRAAPGESRQGELFKASTTWFHVLQEMINGGACAALGPHAVTVYLVIKCHANFHSGIAFPSTAVIAEKAGVCRRKVIQSLRKLQDAGFLTIERRGRRNYYRLKERIEIVGSDGASTALATLDYRPALLQTFIDNLNGQIACGRLETVPGRVVIVKSVNVQINAGLGVQIMTSGNGGESV
ncbi:MAG: helix-turn-helix domain-containing protein [Rhodospirillaceae bacterium]